MTKDRRGREVFSVHPAILGGGARYRTLTPAEADDQRGEDDRAGGGREPGGAGPRAGERAAEPR